MRRIPADVRRAADLLTTPEAHDFDAPPIRRRALRGLLERALGGSPADALAYPHELQDLADWLGQVALKEEAFDPRRRIFAMAAARMADDFDPDAPDLEMLELVRATAAYFFRLNVEIVTETLADEGRRPERRARVAPSNVVPIAAGRARKAGAP